MRRQHKVAQVGRAVEVEVPQLHGRELDDLVAERVAQRRGLLDLDLRIIEC